MDFVILALIAVGLLLLLAAGSWLWAGHEKRKLAAGTMHPTPGKQGPYDKAIADQRGRAYLYDTGTGQGGSGPSGAGPF